MQHGVPQSTPEQQQADDEEQKAFPHIEPVKLPGSVALANWFHHVALSVSSALEHS